MCEQARRKRRRCRTGGRFEETAAPRSRSAEPNHVPGDEGRGVRRQIGDHLCHLPGRGHPPAGRPGEGCRPRVDPAGVGDGGMDDIGGDAVASQLGGRAEREVDLGRLGGAVGDLLGEAVAVTGGEPDDAAPLARRPTWRRANSAMSSAAARASTANTWSRVRGLSGDWACPNRSVAAGTKVSAIHPDALLTRICTGPSSASAASNSRGTAPRRTGPPRPRPLGHPTARIDSTTKSARAIRVARYAAGSAGSSRPPCRSLR